MLAYLQKNEKPSDVLAAKTAIRTENFLKLNQIKEEIMLNYTQFGFFDHCMKVNGLLASKFSYFLRFFERRNKFRYQLRQKLNGKNEMKAELSSCVLQKFNRYDFLRNEIVYSEKKNLLPLDIVYEPTQDKTKSIYDKFQKGKKKFIKCSTAKQCRYCNNFFVKSEKKMQEHTSCCAGQAGFSYSFDNDKIINYQDNFNKIGDLPFAIYYDFETTTGSTVFFDAKMYVVSYCIVVAFHPSLNLPHLFIYRAYDQTKEELESVSFFYRSKRFF